jgi:hypothetical protein
MVLVWVSIEQIKKCDQQPLEVKWDVVALLLPIFKCF